MMKYVSPAGTFGVPQGKVGVPGDVLSTSSSRDSQSASNPQGFGLKFLKRNNRRPHKNGLNSIEDACGVSRFRICGGGSFSVAGILLKETLKRPDITSRSRTNTPCVRSQTLYIYMYILLKQDTYGRYRGIPHSFMAQVEESITYNYLYIAPINKIIYNIYVLYIIYTTSYRIYIYLCVCATLHRRGSWANKLLAASWRWRPHVALRPSNSGSSGSLPASFTYLYIYRYTDVYMVPSSGRLPPPPMVWSR